MFQDQCCDHGSAHHPYNSNACYSPQLYTDASQWRPRERKHPLNVPRHPAHWYPEHGVFRVPELEEEAKAVGREEAEYLDCAIKGRFEGFEAVGWR